LGEILDDQAPPSGRYLTYDPATSRYEMKVKIGEAANVVLHLRAIGWSGVPGSVKPYRWDGWGSGDLVLTWPSWPRRNSRLTPPAQEALTLTPTTQFVELAWGAEPAGCGDGIDLPFAVFRRRGSSQHWEQVSPLLGCPGVSDTSLKWRDSSLDEDTWYTYTVLRLDSLGEFHFQYGPAQICYEPAGATCTDPQP
jgi:hypothetical protein